ncbi:Os02g0734850 [Oryza sativa Japonica Group]|uniref:Os02g0734850 protein n=1 Tax=Oryza sativa subsp. japonica TaxID=39947 RepID=A0A0P0VP37_ORYSJ|nr:Os02g0734850 [Oryza sativa Japonica Group]
MGDRIDESRRVSPLARRGRWIGGLLGGMGPRDARDGERGRFSCGSRGRGAGKCTRFSRTTRSRNPMAESWLYGKGRMGTRVEPRGRLRWKKRAVEIKRVMDIRR